MFLRALLLICIGLAIPARAAGTRDWRDTSAESRAVFTRAAGPESSVLVSVPVDGKKEYSARAFTKAGREVPVAVVHQSGTHLHVLVRTGSQTYRSGALFYLYYGPGLGEQPSELLNSDAEPITLDMYPGAPGRSLPTDWDKMRYVVRGRSSRSGRSYSASAFREVDEHAPSPQVHSHRSRRSRPDSRAFTARSSTHLVVPKDGLYRFAISCRDAGFLLVDRKIAAQWPGRHPAGRWESGAPVFLEAGPHLLEFYAAAMGRSGPRIGIAEADGKKAFIPIEKYELVSAAVPDGLRIEHRDSTLHAGFSYTIGNPYRFRGVDQVFVPVTLVDFSSNDIHKPYEVSWLTGTGRPILGREKGASSVGSSTLRRPYKGKISSYVFAGLGLHHVEVVVRDELGFACRLARKVDARNLQAVEFAVGAVPMEVFPCLYRRDAVEPLIKITSSGQQDMEFVLEWKWTDSEGKEHMDSRRVSPDAMGTKVRLFSEKAGDLRDVTWELSHKGYSVDGGRMIFCSYPYSRSPARAVEDRLYDSEGNQLFFVSSQAAGDVKQRRISASRLKKGLLCLDDLLSLPRSLTGAESDLADMLGKILNLDSSSGAEIAHVGRHTVGGNLPSADLLVDVAGKIQRFSGVAVVSLGLEHLLTRDDPDEFERVLAVVTDMILARRQLSAVLVTLPPVGPDKERARRYAVAARRVADARGIPVADLYSGFMGVAGTEVLFEGGGPAVSDVGLRLAGQIIARSVIAGYRYGGHR